MKIIKMVLISMLFIISALFINFNSYAQDTGIGPDSMFNNKPEQIEYFYDLQTGDIVAPNGEIVGKILFQNENSIKEGEQLKLKTVKTVYGLGLWPYKSKNTNKLICERAPKYDYYDRKLHRRVKMCKNPLYGERIPGIVRGSADLGVYFTEFIDCNSEVCQK